MMSETYGSIVANMKGGNGNLDLAAKIPREPISGLMGWLLPSLPRWPQTSGLVSRGIRGSEEKG